MLQRLLARPDLTVVALVHASHDPIHNVRRMLKRRFGTWKRTKKNVRKIIGNLPERGQARFQHPHTFPIIDPENVAREHGLRSIDAKRLSDPSFVAECRQMEVDLILVASFGELIPPAVLDTAHFAAINMHPGLLPRYRGGFPEYCALIGGERTAGITCHVMTEKFDTGAILLQDSIEIGTDDLLQLKARMIRLAASMVDTLLDNLSTLFAKARPQRDEDATNCRYPTGYDQLLPSDSVAAVTRKVRAAAGENYEPFARTPSGAKVFALHLSEESGSGYAVQCSDGVVWLDVVRYKRSILHSDFNVVIR